jgi:Protein of unknown function (DUF1016).
MDISKFDNENLFNKVISLLQKSRNEVVKSINQTMVYTYYEIGKMIVEEEQVGKNRAEYGKQTLKELLARLTKEFGKGFSTDNLENMRKFYLVYSAQPLETEKSETLSRISFMPDFQLSWSHYLKLVRIDNNKEK